MHVPFVDLHAQHNLLRTGIEDVLRDALDESAFIGGPRVASFENAFARFCGADCAVAVASGTDALELALRVVGVGPGDVVLTVPNTFIATVEAVLQLGAIPRFIDIDPATYNMDPSQLQTYLTEHCERDSDGTPRERHSGLRIAAILPVHLYGLPAEMDSILALARKFGIEVIEDACQAHGAAYRFSDGHWAQAGTLSRVGCFSFYPGKNLGALGEAGAITTDDSELAARVRVLRDHGQSERYVHISLDGVNARMDAIQAAVLELKLAWLKTWNDHRRQAAAWYTEELGDIGIQLPTEPAGRHHVYHLYVVQVPNRDRMRAELERRGVQTGLHYPIPLHLQPAFARFELPLGSYPVSEAAADAILSIPMYPHISREQVAYVSQQLREVLA